MEAIKTRRLFEREETCSAFVDGWREERSSAVMDASFIALKPLSAMPSLGKRFSPVQLRVGAPTLGGRPQGPQSSQRSSGFHKPAVSGAAPETARHLHAGQHASTQQPADFFCKEFLPGQHRLEAPVFIFGRVVKRE